MSLNLNSMYNNPPSIPLDKAFLEKFYEQVILPRYEDSAQFGKITWIDHGKVGLDAWAHYFQGTNGTRYILLYEDFPDGSYLADDPTHEIIKLGDEPSHKFGFGDNTRLVPNITGYFTLFREK